MLDKPCNCQSERNFDKTLNKILEFNRRASENFYQNSMTIVTNKEVYDMFEKLKHERNV